MKVSTTYIFVLVLLFSGLSCARISTPQGGPEDEDPPVLQLSIPDSAQINYQGKTVVLEFDEWIKANNIESNLTITPSIEGNFKTRVNKQSVILTFQEPFKDSTTYTFNFGNTIQDITNNNVPPNLKLSFSTGPYLDSLEISGTILNLYTQDPAKNTLVSLYALNDSLDITTGKASYFAKTDTAGNFSLTNLPHNQYLIYACLDKNGNLQAETDSELYGFLADTVNLDSNISGINFSIQRLNTKPLRLSSQRPFGKYFDIAYTKPITNYDIQPLNGIDSIYFFRNEPDNIRLFNGHQQYNDTTQLIITASDSLENKSVDTVSYYFIDSKIKAEPFTLQVSPTSNELPSDSQIQIEFNKPVKTINLDSILYQIDSTLTIQLHDSIFVWNKSRTEVSWHINLTEHIKKNQFLDLRIGKGAFISIEQDSTQQFIKQLQLAEIDEAALISGFITANTQEFIVQLLKASDLSLIDEIHNQKEFRFNYLPEGTYFVRLVIDSNQNGKWDTGNILTKTPPEAVQYYYDTFKKTKQIKVRKNWEITDINIINTVNN